MDLTRYPGGFPLGVTIRGLPILNTHAHDVFWVSSSTGADAGEGTLTRPFASLDYAVGRAAASKGTIIMLMPGHTETLTADSAVDVDVAGVNIVGLGTGDLRPTFTFTTAAAADFKLAAANISVQNAIFKCNIASQDMMVEITGVGSYIGNCAFREGTATGLTFITVGASDNDADRAVIEGCEFYAPTAGNYDAAISFAKDMVGCKVTRNHIYGDFDLACVDIPTGGNAQVDVQIADNTLINLLTGQHAIQVNGTGSTGTILRNACSTDTATVVIDSGGLSTHGNTWTPLGDSDFEASPALPELGKAGSQIVVSKTLTSSAVVTGGVDVTGTAANGGLQLVDWSLRTDGTGLANGTNFTLETDNASGAAVFASHAVASLGAAVLIDKKTATLGKTTFLESGKKIVAKCTAADCTGSGTITVDMVFVRAVDTATIAAA